MSIARCHYICLASASAAALLVPISAPVCAQETRVAAAAKDNTTPPPDTGDIVVTAQRRSESLSRTPVAVSVVTADTLQARAILTEKDLQSAVPGLLIRASQNSDQLNYSVRGQSIDAFSFGSPAVLPYQNEVQIPNTASSAFYDIASVQVLKGPQGTLFGRNATGGAVLFTTVKPSDELEGFVTGRFGSFRTRNLIGALNVPLVEDKFLARIAGSYEKRRGYQTNIFNGSRVGSVDRYGLRGTLTIKPLDMIENMTVVDYQKSTGSPLQSVAYFSFAPGENPTAAIPSSVFYSPAVDSIFGPGAWQAYLAAHPQVNPGGLHAFVAEQNARGPYIINVDRTPEHRSKAFTFTNTTTIDLSDTAQLKNIFGYTFAQARDVADIDGTPYGIQYSINDNFLNRQRQVSNEIQILGKAFDSRLAYVIGAFYLKNTLRNQQNTSFVEFLPILAPQTVNYISDSGVRDLAAYAQGTYDLSDVVVPGLSLTAGLRYTNEKNTQDKLPGSTLYNFPLPGSQNHLSSVTKKVSYQVGVNEQLTESLLIYGVTRRSFRSGGFNGAAPPLPGFAEVGGAAFKPELATDVEIGSKFRGRLGGFPATLNVALYRTIVKDQQKTFYANLAGIGLVSLTANVPKSRIQGVEVDGSINPTSWLSIGGSLAYTDAKFTKNSVSILGLTRDFGPYPDTPKWSGNLYANVSYALGDTGTLNLRGDLYGQSKFFFGPLNATSAPGSKIPGYTLVNLRAAIEDVGHSGITVAVIARNVTDKVYYVGGLPTSGVFDVNSVIPGDRRTFLGEITFKF